VLERLRRVSVLLALLLAIAIVAAACGDDDDDDDATVEGDSTTTAAADDSSTTAAEGTTETSADSTATSGDGTTEVDPSLEGEVIISGSSTVEPISAAVGAAFQEAAPGVAVNVDGPGTGDGFARFCAGEIDIADASRAISDEEIALCEEGGITYTELYIGVDALTVATSPANEAVSCLSIADLYALTGPESNGFGNWTDAQELATELGSTTEFPDAPLLVTGPGEESGTYDYYVEAVIEDIATERGIAEDEIATRLDYTASPNDNVIVEGIEGNDSSLGWVGFAYYQAEADRMKAIEIDGGDGCVAPSVETAIDGSYPISRPLYIYVSNANAESNPALAPFVDFYLAGLEATVAGVGYAPLPADAYEETLAAWAGR
jgi:phosphate transport system substrate-binding protein